MMPVAAAGILWLALWLVLTPVPGAEAGAIDNPEGELEQVQKRIQNLATDLASATARYQALQQELEQSERRIGESGRRLHELDQRLAQQRNRLSALQLQRQQQNASLEQQRSALAAQVRAAYVMGRQQRLKILLNQQEPAVVSRMLVYYDYFNRARLSQMAQISSILNDLQQTESEIAGQNERLQALRVIEQDEQQQLAASRQQRQQVLRELDRDLQDQGARLAGLKQDEQQLQELIRKLQQTIEDLPQVKTDERPLKSIKGQLSWPVKGRLLARFGSRKAGNLRWDGVMIGTPEGRKVRAVHRGRVAFADWLRGYGLLLIIDHGNGYMTLYGNNQSLFKETGEWVEAGESVALAGSSGGRRKSGVYFGIRVKGKAVNPRKWCRRTKGNRVGQLRNRALGTRSNHTEWSAVYPVTRITFTDTPGIT